MDKSKYPEEFIPYLALDIDGGSSIGIVRNKKGIYFASVRMRRATPEMLDYYHKYLPGTRSKSKTKDGRDVHWINWICNKAYNVLELVADYVDDKQEQVILILGFRDHVEQYRKKHGNTTKLTEEERAWREKQWRLIRSINSKIPVVDISKEGDNFTVPLEEFAERLEREAKGEYDEFGEPLFDPNEPIPPLEEDVPVSRETDSPPTAPSDEEEIKSIFD